MKIQRMAAALAAISISGLAGVASAQEADVSAPASATKDLRAADHSFELTIGTGYTQAFGKVASGQPNFTDTATAGGAVQIGAGYRLIPELTLGLYGSGAMFGRGDQVDSSAHLYSVAAGAQADWHFMPSGKELDPWLSLGTGWRGYWTHTDAGTVSVHGLELAKLQAGLDYRVSRQVSLGPVVGADMSLFLTREGVADSSFSNIDSPTVNTFVFGGLLGRFDIATLATSDARVAAR